ncbi:Uncharacterized conserved protein, DUF2267 family [Nannocystis exedens]|uniref:Uncharacterized conserved protein, DUF2267 family n=1 Tax=Nannocystis exedens TaxID=54 RepID=A0A1I2GTK9_9BACT|nr:DUF2267 domain-containing protein [Nannocystis exedens]PCC74062.1 hypothetical protein NAEX_07151 [Nannocystis exedens]SFF21274.1 Uncharacterized conserved protein, DUF2267 family [Nannocystis exedens]
MSSAIDDLFQETLQTTRTWIREIMAAIPAIDAQQAYHLLCATLRSLRDRLPVEDAVQLAAQLPVLIRGLFYDGWRPTDVPLRIRDRQEFLRLVAARYQVRPLHDLEEGVRAVLAVMSRNIDFGETFSLLRTLPQELRELWPEHIRQAA